jgi:hypothetical protein
MDYINLIAKSRLYSIGLLLFACQTFKSLQKGNERLTEQLKWHTVFFPERFMEHRLLYIFDLYHPSQISSY